MSSHHFSLVENKFTVQIGHLSGFAIHILFKFLKMNDYSIILRKVTCSAFGKIFQIKFLKKAILKGKVAAEEWLAAVIFIVVTALPGFASMVSGSSLFQFSGSIVEIV